MFPFEWHPSEVKKILSVGIPSGFENGLFQLGKLLLLSMIATFGTASTAANAVGNTLGSFQCLPGNAIGLAMIAVVGQCCGAHAYDQAKFYTKKLMQIVYLCMGTLNILMLLCNPIITLPFNLSPEATVLARQIVALHGAGCVIFWPMSFTMPNALRAAGDAKYTMTVAVFSMAVFRIGFGVFLATTMSMGVIGVWIAMQIDWVFRIICFLIRWHSGKWQTKTLV
jgi:Na+-driven multidrug efflux pump